MFWMLYFFFWTIHRCLNFVCRCFGTYCSVYIGGVSRKNMFHVTALLKHICINTKSCGVHESNTRCVSFFPISSLFLNFNLLECSKKLTAVCCFPRYVRLLLLCTTMTYVKVFTIWNNLTQTRCSSRSFNLQLAKNRRRYKTHTHSRASSSMTNWHGVMLQASE